MKYELHNYYINKYFDELNKLAVPVRQSMLFKRFTENIPIHIKDDDLFAGWYGFSENSGEFSVNPQKFVYNSIMSSKQKNIHRSMGDDLKIGVSFTAAHTCIDYSTIINKGLIYYIEKIENELKSYSNDDMLKAMKISLEATIGYAERFKALTKELLEKSHSEQEKNRLNNIYNALCRVPKYSATNFLEAVQAIWIMHSLIPIAEMSWASISIGRIDQYLYPFYKKAINDGCEVSEIKSILKQLFVLLDSYGDGACAMNIGGMDINGNDMLNELSEILIDVEKEMSLRAPIFAVRVTPKTSHDILDKVIDFDLFKIGQPTFYGEIPCRSAVMGRGIEMANAVQFSANSCMGLILAGQEFADMWGIKFNMHLPLELAVNFGKPLNADLSFKLRTVPKQVSYFDELLEQYNSYLEELIEISAKMYRLKALEQEANSPDPLLSALTEGCIESRRDRAVGAKYNTVTVETMGMINTCDALEAIRELVFEQKKYTLKELVCAVQNNFNNAEGIMREIRTCKKYGENDAKVNSICKAVGEMVASACQKQTIGNMLFIPSLHTIDANVDYGLSLYATLDGRMEGEPVNKNANPSGILKKIEPTSIVLSAASVRQTQFSGGQPIDIYFDKSWFDTKESRDKIKNLILTYFELGGLQFQVNSIDIELLEKAHKEPEKYPFVIVRKGGYSVRFNEMGVNERADFLEALKKNGKNG